MKPALPRVTLATAMLFALPLQAQPAYQYNDRYPSHSYFPSSGAQQQPPIHYENNVSRQTGGHVAPRPPQQPNTKDEIWFGGPPPHVGDGVVVHSPPPGHTLKEHRFTKEEMHNAKPMGKYIDAPSGGIKPLPRGGNQPPPSVPLYYSAPGVISGDPGAQPQAMQGYAGTGNVEPAPRGPYAPTDKQPPNAKPMGRYIAPPKGGVPVLPKGSNPLADDPRAVALPGGGLQPMSSPSEGKR